MTRLDANGQPLPELVDFRLTPDRKRLYLFIQEGDRYYHKRIDMTRPGAGLWSVNPALGNATFTRSNKFVDADEVDGVTYERFISQKFVVTTVSRDVVRALSLVLWGHDESYDWPAAEDVQPVQLETLAEAAD